MRIPLTTVYLVVCLILISKCTPSTIKNEVITVYCDHFPELKIDSFLTDTSGLKKFVTKKFTESYSDSIIFNIECPDNIVIENIIKTEMIIKDQINQTVRSKTKFKIYNNCLANLSPPNHKSERVNADVVVRIDNRGNLLLNDSSITLEAICDRYKGQNIRIELIPDESLPADKLISILDKLRSSGFAVIL